MADSSPEKQGLLQRAAEAARKKREELAGALGSVASRGAAAGSDKLRDMAKGMDTAAQQLTSGATDSADRAKGYAAQLDHEHLLKVVKGDVELDEHHQTHAAAAIGALTAYLVQRGAGLLLRGSARVAGELADRMPSSEDSDAPQLPPSAETES